MKHCLLVITPWLFFQGSTIYETPPRMVLVIVQWLEVFRPSAGWPSHQHLNKKTLAKEKKSIFLQKGDALRVKCLEPWLTRLLRYYSPCFSSHFIIKAASSAASELSAFMKSRKPSCMTSLKRLSDDQWRLIFFLKVFGFISYYTELPTLFNFPFYFLLNTFCQSLYWWSALTMCSLCTTN